MATLTCTAKFGTCLLVAISECLSRPKLLNNKGSSYIISEYKTWIKAIIVAWNSNILEVLNNVNSNNNNHQHCWCTLESHPDTHRLIFLFSE